jgi:hypothetical protein
MQGGSPAGVVYEDIEEQYVVDEQTGTGKWEVAQKAVKKPKANSKAKAKAKTGAAPEEGDNQLEVELEAALQDVPEGMQLEVEEI